MLLHGFCRNGELYRGWVPHLARQRRVLRPDLPGCGGSADPGPSFEYSLDGVIDELCALLDARGVARAHFVGEGLGAIASAVLATRDPSRVASLTLLSLPTRLAHSTQDLYRLGYASWQEALTAVGVEAWWRRAREATHDLTGDSALDDHLAAQVAQTPTHIAITMSRCGSSWDLADILPNVDVPALIVGPERTLVTSGEQQASLAAMMPRATLRIHPEITQQFFMYTDPDLVAPGVAEFVDSVD